MFKSSLLSVRTSLLRVTPVVLVVLALFAAKPASASPVTVNVTAQGAGLLFQGTVTGSLAISPSGWELDASVFNIPEGGGEAESFFADVVDSGGTLSGDATISVTYSGPPFGTVSADDTLTLTSGTFSLVPGNLTATLSGTGYFCDALCNLTGAPGQTGFGYLSFSAAPTPEPSSLLLLATGLLGLLAMVSLAPAIRRRFAQP